MHLILTHFESRGLDSNLLFFPFQLFAACPTKDSSRLCVGSCSSAKMASTNMVSTFVTPASCSTSDSTAKSQIIVSPTEARVSTSSISKIDFNDLPSVRHRFSQYGLSSSSLEIIMVAWHDSTKKQYTAHIKKWLLYCSTNNCNPVHLSLATALEFLTSLYQQGLSFSSINTARSALSSF